MKVSMCVHEQGLAGTQGSLMVREGHHQHNLGETG